MCDATRHYINGQWVATIDGREMSVENPSTVEKIPTITLGGLGCPDGLNRSHFVHPTIFADVTPEMTIWKEEIFAPVLCITPLDGEDEAIALASDTPYGLTNYVQTSDKSRARRVARRLQSGMVEMNGKPGGAGSPFGGMKQSGSGREAGVWGLEELLEVKAVSDWG